MDVNLFDARRPLVAFIDEDAEVQDEHQLGRVVIVDGSNPLVQDQLGGVRVPVEEDLESGNCLGHVLFFPAVNFLINGPSPASFSFIFVFSNNITITTTNICEKMFIQYTVQRVEPTTFGI